MPHRPASSFSASALRAAKKDGRFFAGNVYNTKAQRDAAQRTSQAIGRPNPTRNSGGVSTATAAKLGLSPSGGWGPSETASHLLAVSYQADATWDVTKRLKLFGAGNGDIDFTALTSCSEVQLLGLRLEVTYPADCSFARFVCALVTNDAAAGKGMADVAHVAHSVKSHELGLLSAWFTLKLDDVPVIRVDGQTAEPTTMLYLRAQGKGTTAAEVHYHVHATYRKSKGGAAGHVL